MAVVPVAATLNIASDVSILKSILKGYTEDSWCRKLASAGKGMAGVRIDGSTGLWYAGSRLIIPRVGNLRESLFRLAHDTAGHWGADISYGNLRDAYYWPNMRRDLESAYVPSCADCQRNKASTRQKAGPLHPLPIPDQRGDAVAIDFIGPLPEDNRFDCIATFTDRLGAGGLANCSLQDNDDGARIRSVILRSLVL